MQSRQYIDDRMARSKVYYFAPPRENINMRVSDTVRKSTVFVGVQDVDGTIKYGGTAFLVMVPAPINKTQSFTYVVTAKHVLEEIQKEIGQRPFVIRVNKSDGTSVMFTVDLTHWTYHPDASVDAAVSIFSAPQEIRSQLDIRFIPVEDFITDQDITEYAIGPGDEVFMTGLFTKAAGTSQNMPIVRMGNVALMPTERIPHGNVSIEAYLVEGRSIGGLSGSPVFVCATIKVGFPSMNPKEQQFYWAPATGFFFGLARGHWDVPPNRTLLEAEKVNMGISVVVPASKIKEILYLPELQEMRRKTEEAIMKIEAQSAALDTGFEKKEFTQEDFEAALTKVTRKVEDKKK